MHHDMHDDMEDDFVIESATSNAMPRSSHANNIRLDRHAADTAFFQTIEEMQQEKRSEATKKEFELNQQMREQHKQRMIEQRAEMAVTQILPLVPHFSVEQVCHCAEDARRQP